MYASNEAWEADAALLSEKIEKLGSFQGRLGEGAKVFLEVFRLHDETNMLFEKVYVYANQRHHEDTGNSFFAYIIGLGNDGSFEYRTVEEKYNIDLYFTIKVVSVS